MARINIEDSLDGDKRFFKLAVALKSQELAMGVMVFAWRLAQKYWKTETKLIPLSDFMEKISFSEEIIKAGMAKVENDLVYVRGAEEQFQWIYERREAGKKGGQKKSEAKLANLKQNRSKPKQTEAKASTSKQKLANRSLTSPHLTSPQEEIINNFFVEEEPPTERPNNPILPVEEFFAKIKAEESLGYEIVELKHNTKALKKALENVKDETLAFWLNRYDPDWLKLTLTNAVQHYTEKGESQKLSVMNEWSPRLGKWLRNEKKSILRQAGGLSVEELDQFEARLRKNEGVGHEN